VDVEPHLNRLPFVQREIVENIGPLPGIIAHSEDALRSDSLFVADLGLLPIKVDVVILGDGHIPKGQGGADGIGRDSDSLI
jgi:hypothetical protein